jgi:hypothetical protein
MYLLTINFKLPSYTIQNRDRISTSRMCLLPLGPHHSHSKLFKLLFNRFSFNLTSVLEECNS